LILFPSPNFQFFILTILAIASTEFWFITIPIFLINPITAIFIVKYKKEINGLNKIYFVLTIVLQIILILFLIYLLINGFLYGFEISM